MSDDNNPNSFYLKFLQSINFFDTLQNSIDNKNLFIKLDRNLLGYIIKPDEELREITGLVSEYYIQIRLSEIYTINNIRLENNPDYKDFFHNINTGILYIALENLQILDDNDYILNVNCFYGKAYKEQIPLPIDFSILLKEEFI